MAMEKAMKFFAPQLRFRALFRYSAAGMAHNAGEGGSAPAGPAEAIGTRAGSVNKL